MSLVKSAKTVLLKYRAAVVNQGKNSKYVNISKDALEIIGYYLQKQWEVTVYEEAGALHIEVELAKEEEVKKG